MKVSDIAEKMLMSMENGQFLGSIMDFTIDLEAGKVNGVILSNGNGKRLFHRGEEIEIPWSAINRIGVDAILVDPQQRTSVYKSDYVKNYEIDLVDK